MWFLMPKLRQNLPRPYWGSSQRSPSPLAACKGREEEMGGERKGGKGRGVKGREGEKKEGRGGKEGMRRQPSYFKMP